MPGDEPANRPRQPLDWDRVVTAFQGRRALPGSKVVVGLEQAEQLAPNGHVFAGVNEIGELVHGQRVVELFFKILSGGEALLACPIPLFDCRRRRNGWVRLVKEGNRTATVPVDERTAELLVSAWASLQAIRDLDIRAYYRLDVKDSPIPLVDFRNIAVDAFDDPTFARRKDWEGESTTTSFWGLWGLLSRDHPLVLVRGLLDLFFVRSDVVRAVPEMVARAVQIHGEEVLERIGVPAARGASEQSAEKPRTASDEFAEFNYRNSAEYVAYQAEARRLQHEAAVQAASQTLQAEEARGQAVEPIASDVRAAASTRRAPRLGRATWHEDLRLVARDLLESSGAAEIATAMEFMSNLNGYDMNEDGDLLLPGGGKVTRRTVENALAKIRASLTRPSQS